MKGKSNPVAKHLRTFNKATVQRDRKKDSKLGKKNKYKKDIYKEDGDLEKARDNVGRDSCWDGYKAKDTKMKNGKMVPDCKKESSCEGDSSERKTKSLRALRFEYKTKYKNEARIDPTGGKSTSRDSSVKQVKSKADFMKGRKDTRKKPRLSHKEEFDEGLAVKSGNESGGYYNASYNIKHGKNEPKTKADYVKTHAEIKKMTGGKDSQIKDYLDSKRGRHLVGKEQDKLYVKKDFSKWIRSYNPDDYRWESVEQVDEISRGMKNRYIQRAAMSAASNAHSDGISKTTGRKNNHKDKVLNRLRGINRATKESSEDFTPHDMFDPKTGEKKRAETLDMHLALKAKGWGHSKNESVEQVDEGLMNDIRDFIVAVGAAIPTKKNKNNAKWKSLENEIRMAMEADPEFDKLVRNAAYVRKDGIIAFRSGTHSKIDAYVRKTVDSKAAEKLGTLQKGYIKTLKSGEKRNIGRSSDFTKKQQADIDSGKTVYDDDMESTLRHTTNAISKVIKSVTQRAHYDAKKEQKNESVEFNESISDLMEANLPINMLIPNGVGSKRSLGAEAKSLMKDAWRALTGKQKSVIAKVHKLTQSDDELGKLYRDGWKGGGTSMKPGARKAFDARVKELLPNEQTRDYVAAWKSVRDKVKSAMKDQQNESVEQIDEISRGLATRYVGKARTDIKNQDKKMDDVLATKRSKQGLAKFDKAARKQDNRFRGINRALPKMREDADQVDELTQREKEMIADRKAKRMSKAGRKDRNTRLLPKTTTYVRPSKGEDDHIVMQLRKAQDSANFGNGEFDIRVSPVKGAATVSLKKPQIDKLLAVHDKLEKPDQKRKYRITLLKTLRSMQQKKK